LQIIKLTKGYIHSVKYTSVTQHTPPSQQCLTLIYDKNVSSSP